MIHPCPFCNYELGSGVYCGNCMAHRCTGSGIPDAALDDKMLGGKRPQRETVGFGWNKAIQQMHGPAPKEERMQHEPEPIVPARRCNCCPRPLMKHEHEVCDDCLELNAKAKSALRIELRVHYDAVYLAAIGGVSGHIEEDTTVVCKTAHCDALESVRTHAARMAELDALIGDLA